MRSAIPIYIPMESVNDDTVTLVKWLVADGAEVSEGDSIAEVETSKAAIELLAPAAGRIALAIPAGHEVAVGAVVGYLHSDAAGAAAEPAPLPESVEPEAQAAPTLTLPEVRFSRKAGELMERHGLRPELFAGRGMVREADVLAMLERAAVETPEGASLHRGLSGVTFAGVTLPAFLGDKGEGKLDPQFLSELRANRKAFGELSSDEKCEQYRRHGALIGADVTIGQGTVILTPHLVLADEVKIGGGGSVECGERFIMGRLSSFRSGLVVEGATVVLGENVFACNRVEISGGLKNPWSALYVGDTAFIGDDVILDVSRPIAIGKEVFLTQRSIVITHNIGHSVLEGYENRFESVVLEDRSQVGMSSTIYAGSRIGSGAIVASNSYVISAVPAGKLAMGVPARVVRDAARLPDRARQVRIALNMVSDFRELLQLRGHNVSPVEDGRFRFEGGGEHFNLEFFESYSPASPGGGFSPPSVIWTLEAQAGCPPGCTLFDLLAKTVQGQSSVFADSSREFLRKRGIRFEPGPWRYRTGLI